MSAFLEDELRGTVAVLLEEFSVVPLTVLDEVSYRWK
jgi:hypothetical protein